MSVKCEKMDNLLGVVGEVANLTCDNNACPVGPVRRGDHESTLHFLIRTTQDQKTYPPDDLIMRFIDAVKGFDCAGIVCDSCPLLCGNRYEEICLCTCHTFRHGPNRGECRILMRPGPNEDFEPDCLLNILYRNRRERRYGLD